MAYGYSDDNSYTIHIYVVENAETVPRMPDLVRVKFLCNSKRSVPVIPGRSKMHQRMADDPGSQFAYCKRCKQAVLQVNDRSPAEQLFGGAFPYTPYTPMYTPCTHLKNAPACGVHTVHTVSGLALLLRTRTS